MGMESGMDMVKAWICGMVGVVCVWGLYSFLVMMGSGHVTFSIAFTPAGASKCNNCLFQATVRKIR